jgi:hypothetical protein
MAIKARYIRFTEEKAFMFISNVDVKPIDWKWVILSLHSALYGFAVAACRGTNSRSVIMESRKGRESLISFDEAIRRCKAESFLHGCHLELKAREEDSIRK